MNVDISRDDLPRIICNFFKEIDDSGIMRISQARSRSVIVDEVYQTVEPDLITGMLTVNPLLVNSNSENSGLFDCDDYALQLKAQITALFRQKYIGGETSIKSPAIGIIVTRSHVLNLVLTSVNNSISTAVIDPSSNAPTLIYDSESASDALKLKPIQVIYI